jgi:hypothetical protein
MEQERLHEPISIHREQEGITVDVALQWYILPFPQVAIVLFYMNFYFYFWWQDKGGPSSGVDFRVWCA